MSDYISREALVDRLSKNLSACNPGTFSEMCYADAIETVKHFPAADVEPVRNGRWEECDWVDVDEHGFGTRRTFKAGLRCSQCACVFKKKLLWKRDYCPSCGAKMDLEDNDES